MPLYGELPDHRSGNSTAAQRIAHHQAEACLAPQGQARFGLVVGDREFVGHTWRRWLQDNGLNFVMRRPSADFKRGYLVS